MFPFLAMSKQKYEKVVDYQLSQILLITEAALSSEKWPATRESY